MLKEIALGYGDCGTYTGADQPQLRPAHRNCTPSVRALNSSYRIVDALEKQVHQEAAPGLMHTRAKKSTTDKQNSRAAYRQLGGLTTAMHGA